MEAWTRFACDNPRVAMVVAHTLPSLAPSIRRAREGRVSLRGGWARSPRTGGRGGPPLRIVSRGICGFGRRRNLKSEISDERVRCLSAIEEEVFNRHRDVFGRFEDAAAFVAEVVSIYAR